VATVHSDGDTARTLAESAERDLWDDLVLAAWRDGYRAGAAAEYSRGYQAAIADVKSAEHDLVAYLSTRPGETVRWALRGEPRTRATFGQPHRDDYPGRSA
jgi:hypothetical protein